MEYATGSVWTGEGFAEGYIGFEEGEITEIGKGAKKDAEHKGIIIPTFFNAHIHTGDSFIHLNEKLSVEDLVRPPDGLKHRMLREAEADTIIDGMKGTINTMLASGTCHFADFREGGVKGLEMLDKAIRNFPGTCIGLARPEGVELSGNEMDMLLSLGDGVGMSGIGDWEYDILEKISKKAHERGKLFALHASEARREDMDAILDLKPDFLVHMIHATDADLCACADEKIPIAVCPRANSYFGLRPPIKRMLDAGIDVMLGTDNAMLASPSILEEIQYIWKNYEGIECVELLKMAVDTPRKVLNAQGSISFEPGRCADFLVFRTDTQKSENSIVNEVSESNIGLVCVGGHKLRNGW